MTVNNKFDFGDVVFVKTDTEQLPRIITNMEINPGGTIIYVLYAGVFCSKHYDFELADEPDITIKTSN